MRKGLGSNDEARKVDWWTDHEMNDGSFTWAPYPVAFHLSYHPLLRLAAFKLIIDKLTSRVNHLTGIKYADDPTILAWETGNEMNHMGMRPAPGSWTLLMAA